MPARVAALVARLADRSWAVRRAVIAELATAGDAAIGALCEVLRTQRDDETRLAAAVDALVASRGDADLALLALIDDAPSAAVMVDAIQALGRRRSAEAVPVFVRLASDRDDNVAMSAIEALGRIGGGAGLESLMAIVESGNFFRRFPAIDVLGRSGDPRAIAPLVRLLDDPLLAPEAVRALGRVGDAAAIAPLTRLLARGSEALARVAAVALCDIHDRHAARYGSPERVEDGVCAAAEPVMTPRHLGQALTGADPAEQAAICRVLGWLDDESAGAPLFGLLDADPTVAAAARRALRRLGRDADLRIVEELGTADGARRLILLPHVAARASPIENVVRCLDDPDGAVRALACEALARIGNPAAVPALFARLGDPDTRVAQAVMAAIQSIAGSETERLAIEAARSPNPQVRRAALRIAAYFGYAAAVDLLIGAIAEPDERLRDAAIAGLPFIEDARARDALLAAARHGSPRTRAAAMRALGHLPEDPRVRPALSAALADPDAWVRYYACQSLGKLAAAEATEAILALVSDPAVQVRVAAIEALARLPSPRAGAALREAAASEHPDIRRAALLGIGIRRDQDSLSILLQAAEAPETATRLIAVSALARFESAEVLPALARAASDWDELVREAAIGHLASRPGAAATQMLVGLLPNAAVGERAVAALATPAEGRIDQILAALGSAGPETAPLLVAALARTHRPEARAALVAALGARSVDTRRAAARALGASKTATAATALERAATEDPDPEVRRLAAAALGR